MGMPLPPNVIPISAAGAARVVPLLRIVPAAAAVAPAAAGGGLVGALAGTALPLAASFALGFEVGTQLLRLWNWLNQALKQTPVIPADGDTETWPTAKAGQTVTYYWAWVSHGYFDATYAERIYRTTTAIPVVGTVDPNAYYEGFGIAPLSWGGNTPGTTNGGWPGYFRLLSHTTSNGQPANVPTTSNGSSVDRAPLVAGAGQPLAAVPLPMRPPAALPSPVPSIPATPAPAPAPGQPAPAPAAPGAVPGGAPGRQPGGRPAAPGIGPAPQIPLQPIGDPVKGPAPATVPTVDPARPPLTFPAPGTVPVAPPPLVPVTDPDLIKIGNLIIGDPGERPRPDLVSISRELGRQEQKLAGLLGGLGLPEAFDQLLDLFKSINTGTTYSLTPPCGTTAGGEPLPAVEVIVPPTIGVNAAVIARIDALAMLLDEHKQMRQPICKGKPTGQPVTVTAVEIE